MRDLREEADRFDRQAGAYDRWLKQWWFFRPVHRLVVDALAPLAGQRVLEVGCGTGNLTLKVAARAAQTVGIDPAPKMISVARRKRVPPGGTVAFLVGAAESLPFPDAAFDAATTSISMHHWVDPAAGLREVRRVLRPGGRLVAADMAPRGLGRIVGLAAGMARPGHRSHWDPQALAQLVRSAGFERVRLRGRGRLASLVALVAAERSAAD